MTRKVFWGIIALIAVFVSCSDDDNEESNGGSIENPTGAITIDSGLLTNGLDFTTEGGEKSITFTTDVDWTLNIAATSGATWCTASANRGSKGEASVKFTTVRNEDYDDRSVSVTIKAGTASKTFTITQKCAEALLVTTDKYELEREGGTIEVEVKANINYELQVSETAKSWISQTTTRALTIKKHSFTIAANEETEKREGEIYIKSGDKLETVKVYQSGGPSLLLTQKEYTVSDKGGTIAIDIKSNFDFTVQMPNVDWIEDITTTRGLSSHTLKYVIAPNESYDSRSAQIIYYDKNSSLKDTLTVVQTQKDAILLSKKAITVKSDGETIEVKLSANVNYEMILPELNWINVVSTRSLVDHKEYLTVAENKSESQREAKVIFKSKSNKETADTLYIIQNGYGVIQVTKSEYTVESGGGDITINLRTNGDYEIVMPKADWISHKAKTKAVSSYTESFTIAPNSTYDERKEQIIFKVKSGTADTVTVIQKPQKGIVLSKKEVTVKAEKDTLGIVVSSNVTIQAEIPSSSSSWIKQYVPNVPITRALSDSTVYFIIAENKDYNARNGYIIFREKNNWSSTSSPKDTIQIKQEGYSITVPSLVLNVKPAGSLNTLIADSRKKYIEEMKLTGELNGTDFAFIKEMSKLKNLDLSEANIVEGGSAYYHSDQIGGNYEGVYVPAFDLYTKPNSIIGNMFPTSLQVLTVPKSLTTFSGYSVTTYKRKGNRIDGWRDTPNGSTASYIFNNYSTIKKIIFPDGITLKKLGEYSFYRCNSLHEITLPDCIEKIGRAAFNDCNYLTTINIPNTVTEIESQAFLSNGALCSIKLPDKLTYIADSLFMDCNSLSNITIPQSVIRIDTLAFANSNINSINIPNSVKSIANGAFMNCRNLTTVTLPNSITSLKYFTFAGTGITKITIPNNVTEIEAAVFYKCDHLESINIPQSVKAIAYSAFEGCSQLSSVTLPESINVINESVFKNCSSLTRITIPENVTEIKESAFYGCNIQSLIIPNKVTNIGNNAFYNNKALTKVTFGTRLLSIGTSAFSKYWNWNDSKIYYSDVICLGTIPAKIPSGTFANSINDDTKLYIPKGTYNAYYLSEWANVFKNIVDKE